MIPETDEVLVNRNGTTYKTKAEQMANLEDTDLMLVNRDGVTYTVTGEEIKDSIQSDVEPDITSVVLTQNQVNANRYTSNQFTTTVTYAEDPYPPQSVEMTAKVVGALSIEAGTDLIASNDYTGTASTSVPLTLNSDIYLTDGTFEVGDVVKASASHTPKTSSIASIQAGLYSNYSIENGFSSSAGTGAFTVSGSPGSEYFDKANHWNQGQHDTTVTVNFNPPIPFQSSVRVYAWGSRPSHQCTVYTSLGNYVTTNLVNESGDITNKANKYDGTGTVSKLVFTGAYANNTGYSLGGIMVDENVTSLLRVEPTSSSRSGVIGDPTQVLSFNDAKDIALFEAGDLVQAADPTATQMMGNWAAGITGWTPVTYAGTPINAFDGNDTTYVLAESPTSKNLYWQAKDENGSNITITNITKLEVNWSVGDPAAFYINGSKVADYPGASGGWRDYSANATSLTSIRVENKKTDGGAATLSGIRINDQYLIDNIYGVLIEETDVLAKTITVDGGTWNTSNQSQVWSDTISATADHPSGNPPSLAFNGIASGTDTNTFLAAANNSIIWDCSSYNLTEDGPVEVEVYTFGNASSDNRGWKVNDGNLIPEVNTGSPHYLTLGTFSTLNKIESVGVSPDGGAWSAIKINGRLLVDAAYDDQFWSTGASIPVTSVDVGSDKTMAFDGNLSNTYRTIGQNGTISLDFSSFPISYTTSVEVYCTTAGTDANVAGSSASQMPVNSWGTIATGSGTLFGITLTNANAKTSIAAVRVDGKLLIDKGARGLGDNKVSAASPKQGEGTISDITGSVVTISPYTDNCFKEGQYLTHATPKPIKVTPQTEAINTVSSDGRVLTFAGIDDLFEFSAGDPVSMVEESGNPATATPTTDTINGANGVPVVWSDRFSAGVGGQTSTIVTYDPKNVFDADTSNFGGGSNVQTNQTGSWNLNVEGLGFYCTEVEFNCSRTPYEGNSDKGLRIIFDYADGSSQGVNVTTPSNAANRLAINPYPEKLLNVVRLEGGNNSTVGGGGGYGPANIQVYYIIIDGVLLQDTDDFYYDLFFDSPTNLNYFRAGDVLVDKVTQVTNRSVTAQVGDFVPEHGGTYRGLFNPQGGATFAYFYGGKTPSLAWSNSFANRTNMSSLTDGSANTENAVTATLVCYDAKVRETNGFTDWFICAKDEAIAIDIVGQFPGTYFWTSTNADENNAWIYFSNQYRNSQKGASSYPTPFYRKVQMDAPPEIAFVDLTVDSPQDYQVGDVITQDITGATGTINSVGDGVITLEGVSGTFLPDYLITGDNSKSIVVVENADLVTNSMRVAGGKWNNYNTSQVWSDNLTFTPNAGFTGDPTNVFNGSKQLPGYGSSSGNPGDLNPIIFTPATPIPYTRSVRVFGASGQLRANLNGLGWINGVSNTEVVLAEDSAGVITEIQMTEQRDNASFTYTAIEVDGNLLVDTGVLVGGATTATTQKSGTGVVSSVNVETQTMTLSETNAQWVPGYYVTTPEKNVVEKTGYLKFDAFGNVETLSRLPQAAVIMTNVNPVLTFPAQFGTGEVPDTELPYPTFLQTEITAKNTFSNGQVNTDTKASNILFPETNTRSVPASGEKRTTAEGLAQFIANVDTFSGREAAANTDPTDVQGAFTAAQTDINDYIAGL